MKKWLGVAMTTASRRKAIPTLEHRDKGVHSMVVMSLPSRATALYWGQEVVLNGVKRVLATTLPDTQGELKLHMADLNALTKVVYTILPADVAEGAGLCAGTAFTKAKATTDFPSVVNLLPPDADDDRCSKTTGKRRQRDMTPTAPTPPRRAPPSSRPWGTCAPTSPPSMLASRLGTLPGSRPCPPTTTSSKPSRLRSPS